MSSPGRQISDPERTPRGREAVYYEMRSELVRRRAERQQKKHARNRRLLWTLAALGGLGLAAYIVLIA